MGLELAGGWVEADCVWRTQRLVVELDGYASHGTSSAFERDRARDRMLQAAGWRVLRITWRHLHDEPETVASQLRTLLLPGRDCS
jgi:very-short-patch-repair endonuclease